MTEGDHPPSGLRVMVVEDEFLIALDIAAIVEGAGHIVCCSADSAPEAVRLAGVHVPDVAIMDLQLARGTSGIDAATALRARFGIRCVFLSGNLTAAMRVRLAPLDPVAMLAKPFLDHQLTDALRVRT